MQGNHCLQRRVRFLSDKKVKEMLRGEVADIGDFGEE